MIKFKCKIKLLQSLLVAVILLLPGYAHSQVQQKASPGRADSKDVELWLKADAGVTVDDPNSNRVVVWKDQSGKGRDYKQTVAVTTGYPNRPLYNKASDLMNFQPSLLFANAPGTTQVQAYNRLLGPADTEYNVTGKAFYMFYVSKNTSASNSSLKTVFSFNRNRNNITGWYGYTSPAFTNRATGNRASVEANKRYAIVGAIRTNSSSGSLIYVNGVPNAVTITATMQAAGGSTYVQSIIGSSASSNSNSMYGHIQEIIMVSGGVGNVIDPVLAQKINSYLAVKYGITLNKTVNYVNSRYTGGTANVVWNQSTNSAYNQVVFGIARDDSTGLLVNQARSYDARTIAVFVGNALSALNSQNKDATLDNGDYLMLGGDSIQTFKNYVYNEGDAYSNGILGTNLNTHGRVYKAQRTGKTDYLVSILPDNPSAKYVVVSDDPNFSLTNINTRLYDVEGDGYAKNINIPDGYYVTTAYNNIMPGGVNATTFGLELWLRGDGLTMPDKSDVSVWSDNSLNGRTFGVYGSSQAPKVYLEGAMNYNGAVDFNKSANARLVSDAPFTSENGKTYYISWVGRLNVLSSDYNPVFAIRSGNGTGFRGQTSTLQSPTGQLYISTAGAGDVPDISPATARLNKNYGIATFAVTALTNPTGIPDLQIYHNGKVSSPGTYRIVAGSANMIIGNTDETSTTYNYQGNVQEIIVMSSATGATAIPQTQINQLHSYLAIKYGLTLETNTYVSSDGTSVYNGSFNKNVFGIGRDDASGLYQKQSKSADDPKFAIFIGDKLEEANKNNNGTLDNKEYIMLGSNGAAGLSGLLTPAEIPAGMVKDSLRKTNWVYQVQLTNSINRPVRIKQLSSQARYVMVSTDPGFPVGGSTRYYPLTVANNFTSDPIILANNEYISFLYSVEAPGGVSSGLRMWLHAGDVDKIRYDSNGNIELWEDRTEISGTKYTYMDADLQNSRRYNYPPAYSPAARYMNYRPSVQFRNRVVPSTTNPGEYLSTQNAPGSSAQPSAFTTINVIFQDQGKTNRNYFIGFGGISARGDGAGPYSRHPAFGLIGKDKDGKKLNGQVGRIAYIVSGTDREVQGTTAIAKNAATSINLNHVNVSQGGASIPINTITFEANGMTETRTAPNAFSAFAMNGLGTLGAGSMREASMVGYMAEAIYYEKLLDADELTKIYSALAVKYGVTLRFNQGGGTRYDYKLSDGTSIWDGNASGYQGNFYNNIAGLVRDDDGGLFNNISNSTDSASLVTMMTHGHDPNMGQGRVSELPVDMSYLFWGNDGNNDTLRYFTEIEQAEFCTPANYRTPRIWAVKKSDNWSVANVTLIINNNEDVTGFEAINQNGYRVHLLVANSPDSLTVTANNWKMDVPSVYVKGKGQMIDFNFTDEVTYFTLGVEELNGGGCETCAFKDIQQILFNKAFQKSPWPNKTVYASGINIGYDYEVDSVGAIGAQIPFLGTINLAFTPTSTAREARFVSPSPRLYQNASKGNILYINRTGYTNRILRATIETTSSAAARFQIRGINRYSTRYMTAEVKGYCEPADSIVVGETPIIYPRLTEAKTVPTTTATSSKSSYTIKRNTATAIRTPYVTARYDSRNRNVVNVRFDAAIKTIVVDQILTGATRGSKSISIGDISYYCPAPQPAYNEAGMSLRMTVFPRQVVMCGGVNPFRIEIDVFNADCSNKYISVTDTLPVDMYWNKDGFVGLDSVADRNITISEGGRALKIDSLFIVGRPDPSIPSTFVLSALCDKDATPGTYSNQMWMLSQVYRGGYYEDLPPYPSADLITGGVTPIETVDGSYKLDPVVILNDSANISKCYDEDDVINVSFKVKNPNIISFDSLMFEVEFNEGFTLIDSTLMVNGVYYAPQFEYDDLGTGEGESYVDSLVVVPGYFFIQYNDTLELGVAANGEMTVSFKLKAPKDYNSLEKEMDEAGTKYLDWEGNPSDTEWPKGKQSIIDLGVSATLTTEMDDICKSAGLDEAYSDLTILYCKSKRGLVSNKHVTSRKNPY